MNTKTNLTNGGEGPSGMVPSEETRDRLREYWADPEARARASERSRQYWDDPEARARQSERMRQRMSSPEARARAGDWMQQRWDAPEARARASEKARQYWADPKVRGSIWINNGTENRWLKPDEPMPAGFRRGRVKRSSPSRAA